MEDDFMALAPVIENDRRQEPRYYAEEYVPPVQPIDWVRIAACGSLIAGGCLLVAGKKREGVVLAASGTALALFDHEDTLRSWWQALPLYVDRTQQFVEQVQGVVDNITEKGHSLRR